jgi:DNA invertase Pin-like site-specific DNA recombinase
MRAMLLVLEAVQQYNLTIILARETFDPAMAPLKAWLAQVELDNIKERMTMGVKARLRAGKANSGQDRYGYRRNGGILKLCRRKPNGDGKYLPGILKVSLPKRCESV